MRGGGSSEPGAICGYRFERGWRAETVKCDGKGSGVEKFGENNIPEGGRRWRTIEERWCRLLLHGI